MSDGGDFDPNRTTKLQVKFGSALIDLQSKSMWVLIGILCIVGLVYIGLRVEIHVQDANTQQAIDASYRRDVLRALREIACHVSHPEQERKSVCTLLDRMP